MTKNYFDKTLKSSNCRQGRQNMAHVSDKVWVLTLFCASSSPSSLKIDQNILDLLFLHHQINVLGTYVFESTVDVQVILWDYLCHVEDLDGRKPDVPELVQQDLLPLGVHLHASFTVRRYHYYHLDTRGGKCKDPRIMIFRQYSTYTFPRTTLSNAQQVWMENNWTRT